MDMTWLASEAKQIHGLFLNLFYSIILTLLLMGVVINYFKMPLGQVPEALTLVGRAAVAALLLAALPEIMNSLADVTDQLAAEVGKLNNFKLVLGRLGEKIGNFTWSWVSVKDSVLLLISYVTFFLLYISVYMADTLFLFTWTLLYIFSPILIAAFVLPSTSSATKGLFQALIEVSCWKVTWSVFAALLWSFALGEVNKSEYDIDFFTAILLNILLAFSVVVTPFLVGKLLRGGFHSGAAVLGSVVMSAFAMTPNGITGIAYEKAERRIRAFMPKPKRKKKKGKEKAKEENKSRTDPKGSMPPKPE